MKKIIFLQNHPVFTLDISKIFNPNQYDLYLISIPLCIEQLKNRDQQHLFKEIHALNFFELSSLISLVNKIIDGDLSDFDIVTSSEQAMDICGKLRVHFNLACDDLERYAHKITMKKSLINSNIRIPKFMEFNDAKFELNPDNYIDSICKEISFPMFIKPTNQAGCIGAALIKDIPSLKKWCRHKDKDKLFEIDEHIEGTLYHCDTFIKNEKIIHTQVSLYLNPCFDFIKGRPIGSITLPQNSEDFIRIKEFNKNALDTMGIIKNGITHLEVFKKNDGELVFVEIAARPPASLVPKTYNKRLGVSIMEAHILMQIDNNYIPEIKYGPYSAFVIYPKIKGTVSTFNEIKINSQYDIYYNIKQGDELQDAAKVRDLAGGIVFWNDNFEELMHDFLNFNSFNLYEVSAA